MSVVLENLNKQLEVAVKANVEVHDKIDAGKIAEMKKLMEGFECPEGFNLRFRTYEVALRKGNNVWESARVNIDTDFDFQTCIKTVRASVNANGGREVDDLLAQAQFVQFTSPKLDEFKVAIESVTEYFKDVKRSTGETVREIERAISDVKSAQYQLKMDEVLRQMRSEEGYNTVVIKAHWGGVDYPRLQLKYNHTADVTRVKIVTESLSGKSAHILYDYKLYDGTVVTRGEDNVRMDNINDFIRQQLFRVEKIEEGELEVAE